MSAVRSRPEETSSVKLPESTPRNASSATTCRDTRAMERGDGCPCTVTLDEVTLSTRTARVWFASRPSEEARRSAVVFSNWPTSAGSAPHTSASTPSSSSSASALTLPSPGPRSSLTTWEKVALMAVPVVLTASSSSR